MRNRRSIWALALLTLMGITSSSLAAGSYPSTAQGVLERFLALDADAAGLAAQTWPELARYTTWGSAPAWDRFVVIDHYSLGKIMQGSTRAQATVTYQPLGKLSDTFVPDLTPETVVFHLNRVKGEWRVDNPLPPHVSFAVMQKRLTAASAADPKIKKTNDALILQIEAARQQLKH